jgi:hypothetical protein
MEEQILLKVMNASTCKLGADARERKIAGDDCVSNSIRAGTGDDPPRSGSLSV